MGRLDNKVAIVTGGARNIGAVYARTLAAEGARVVVADVLDGSAAAQAIRDAGGEAVHVEVDVSREDDTQRMAKTAMDAFGRIDVLVNNAAIYVSIQRRPFHEISAEEWDRVTAVNIKGVFLCAKAVFPHMRDQGGGRIINISSNTVMAGTPNFLHYVASKSALIGMTRSMAREMGAYGIGVNAIAPGLVEHEGQSLPPELSASRVSARSVQRRQTPDDLTGTVLYLAASDSDFVTGQTLVVDGGDILY
ncbi:MAG: SDR family oxidoreductase [Deltaproteobacteria bacterium]|nr:SDR family oxidoreductase [Deltaproteobacteria bacterium]